MLNEVSFKYVCISGVAKRILFAYCLFEWTMEQWRHYHSGISFSSLFSIYPPVNMWLENIFIHSTHSFARMKQNSTPNKKQQF